MCTINKSAHTKKKSGNLLKEPHNCVSLPYYDTIVGNKDEINCCIIVKKRYTVE